MSVTRRDFGTTKTGLNTKLYSIVSEEGITVRISDYGANVVSILVPDKDGGIRDVVLGFNDVTGYETKVGFYGAFVGRCCNRIKGSEFIIGGKRYFMTKTEGENNCHSAPDTWNKRLLKVTNVEKDSVTMELASHDMDQGFPGDMDVKVTYSVRNGSRFEIEYEAVSDRDTICNLTNHSYFNLNGGGTILNHLVRILGSAITEVDAEKIPTGRLLPVEGTPFDFRTRRAIGQYLSPEAEYGKLREYDVNYALDADGYGLAADFYSSDSGILMNVYTDCPGLQIYTPPKAGNVGKTGEAYPPYAACCFETQFFPDAIHQPGFKSPILRAGEIYRSKTVYEFQTIRV